MFVSGPYSTVICLRVCVCGSGVREYIIYYVNRNYKALLYGGQHEDEPEAEGTLNEKAPAPRTQVYDNINRKRNGRASHASFVLCDTEAPGEAHLATVDRAKAAVVA